MIKRISIYTNLVSTNWTARDLETGIGGSEEKLIEFAREMAKKKDYEVYVYHNGEHGTFDGVFYKGHKDFRAWLRSDVFISFKAKHILDKSINAPIKIHWSMEVEPEWLQHELDSVDKVLTISKFHKSQMKPQTDKIDSDYLWVDTDRLDRNKAEQEEGTMLYCSSFDRGLEEVLDKWLEVKKKLGLKKLYITYGWEFMDEMVKRDPALAKWKEKMTELLKQDGVELIGRLSNDKMCEMYWKSEYWVLPLNNPQSELFCLNAIKAQYCGSIPVVRRVGALQETVNQFIDWDKLLGEKVGQDNFTKKSIKENKDHASKFGMKEAIQRWNERFERKE